MKDEIPMEERMLKKGDVVQLSPTLCQNEAFAGCFMVITDAKEFGAFGYIPTIGQSWRSSGLAYYRALWIEMEFIGKAEWIME